MKPFPVLVLHVVVENFTAVTDSCFCLKVPDQVGRLARVGSSGCGRRRGVGEWRAFLVSIAPPYVFSLKELKFLFFAF